MASKEVILTEDEIRLLQDALVELIVCNPANKDAFEYPIQKQKAKDLLDKLGEAL